MHKLLHHASIWRAEKYRMWMGMFVASYEQPDHQIRKIVISSYGGFFYDSLSKSYYELPKAKELDGTNS